MMDLVRMARTGCAVAAVMTLGQAARPADAALEGRALRGTVGTARVGAYFVLREGSQFVRGHYFYAAHLQDIPLSGGVDKGTIVLREPEGGVFRLRVRGSATGQPTFANSTGLEGTWTRGARTLPVSLAFDWGGPARDRFYADVTTEPDARYEARVARFLHAVSSNDKASAVVLVSYPLRVNGATPLEVRNRAQLLAHWPTIFTPRTVAALRAAIPHEMFVRDGRAMVGDGVAWFDARGVVALNVVR